ncbi:MAG: SUMF1/EgtB/PvdO family nonheme iron enzyme, partial [Thermodesulfobacteriota bacterium]
MAKLSISMDGIEEAVQSLNYRQNSVKHKAVTAIKSYYTSEDAIGSLSFINTDDLIRRIWNLDDSETSKIRGKRRNFFSIRSSVNNDLKRLAEKGGNPENITITEANIFDMTEEAKNSLLSSFSSALTSRDMDVDQVTDILSALNEFIDKLELEKGDDVPEDLLSQLKQLISKAANDFFSKDGSPDSDTEKEDAEIEEIDGDEELEDVDEVEEIDDDTEEIELDEDEELEEVDELDGDTEEIDPDETETIEPESADESTEEAQEPDDDTEIEEIDGDEELEDVDEVEEIDDDTEEIELDED